MPAICPQCKHYEFLTKPDPSEVARDMPVKSTEIVCENCDWIGEPDDLDWTDSDD